jgi:hypothetical protein
MFPTRPNTGKKDSPNALAIVDCAQLDGLFYQESVKTPQILCKSLLADTWHEKSAIAGPLLMRADPLLDKDLTDKLHEIEQEVPAVMWLWSGRDFDALFPALQNLLFGKTGEGKNLFLRYFDTRCLKTLLQALRQDSASRRTLDHIAGWAYWQNGKYEYLESTCP